MCTNHPFTSLGINRYRDIHVITTPSDYYLFHIVLVRFDLTYYIQPVNFNTIVKTKNIKKSFPNEIKFDKNLFLRLPQHAISPKLLGCTDSNRNSQNQNLMY